jgi:ketosteroid isomerase-like protein
MMSNDEKTQLQSHVLGYYSALERKDIEAILRMLDDVATVEVPVGSPVLKSKPTIRAMYERDFGLSSSISVDVLKLIFAPGMVFSRITLAMETPDGRLVFDVNQEFHLNAAGKILLIRAAFALATDDIPKSSL